MSDPAQTVTPEIKSCATCGDDKTGLRLTGGAPKRYFCTNRTCPDFGTELVLSEWNRRVKSDLLLPSPSEREELASVISHAINFDDGAHHLSMGDDGEPCRACQDVADAVLAKGYSKRSSPSSSEASGDTALLDKLESYGCIEIDKWQSGQRKGVALWFLERKIGAGDDLRTAITYAELPDGSPALTPRSSPSSAGQEARKVLTDLADWYDRDAAGVADELHFEAQRIRDYRDHRFPALSAGETETRT